MAPIVQVFTVLQAIPPALLLVAVQYVTAYAILEILEDLENHCSPELLISDNPIITSSGTPDSPHP